jgi:glycosyltransferase involved in cell wall biosynthesis
MNVTIAIPFFNSAEHLELSILSVLNQTYNDWELILLVDGSTDNCLNIARSYAELDGRIRVFSDGKNRKLPYRLNQVIRLAKYDFIARMDADDLMPDYRIERQVEFLQNNKEFDLVTTGVCSIDEGNHPVGVRLPSLSFQELTLDMMFKGQHQIVHASILVRKSWYLRNMYDEKIERAQDYELWIRSFLANDLKIGYLKFTGYYYREDLGVTKEKLLKTYQMGNIIIDKFGSSLDNIFSKKVVIFAKQLFIKIIFALKLESYFEAMKTKSKIDKEIIFEVTSQIEKLKKFNLLFRC